MPKSKYSHSEVTESLMEVFRKVGYEGASMEELSKAVGLRKSSLYHHFPKGKKQMAEEVLKFASRWVSENIVSHLNSDSDPDERLKRALEGINTLYSDGSSACILRALSMDTGLGLFFTLINTAFDDLIGGFSKLARDFGKSDAESKVIAEDIVIKIQGSLVVGSGTGNVTLFGRMLSDIEASFIGN